jgi:hypothetical protein
MHRAIRPEPTNATSGFTPSMTNGLVQPRTFWMSSRHVYEVDPLVCPRCGAAMKIISFITERQTIRAILESVRRNATVVPGRLAPPPTHRSPGRGRSELSKATTRQPKATSIAGAGPGLDSGSSPRYRRAPHRLEWPAFDGVQPAFSSSGTRAKLARRDKICPNAGRRRLQSGRPNEIPIPDPCIPAMRTTGDRWN